jgi:site-specific recombinase XerD
VLFNSQGLTELIEPRRLKRMQLQLWTQALAGDQSARAARSTRDPRAVRNGIALVRPALVPPAEVDLDEAALRYLRASRADRTRTAYDGDWNRFAAWCGSRGAHALPATVATLACYLAHLAEHGKKASTIRRARVAIGMMHGHLGLPRPDRDDRIRALERGIGRVHGAREEGAKPLLVEDLERLIGALGHSARDDRDRALLLVGFAGAFRASELVVLDVEHIAVSAAAMYVYLPRSKEDQLSSGCTITIPRAADTGLCPVLALERWLLRADARSGPLFRLTHRHGDGVALTRITPRVVSRALERAAARAGIPAEYSAHSLRSGLATSAYANGACDREIQLHGRWKNLHSLSRYIQPAAVRGRNHVLEGVL